MSVVPYILSLVIGLALGSAGLTVYDWQTHTIVLSIATIRITMSDQSRSDVERVVMRKQVRYTTLKQR
jgi:hypothetical protein